MKDGSWTAFEIKLGANQIDEAAANLIKISDSLKVKCLYDLYTRFQF